jgi:hypothetical protein
VGSVIGEDGVDLIRDGSDGSRPWSNDIDHRLTKPKHPWTTDVIDKCFLAGSGLFFARAQVTAWRRAGREVQALPRNLHCRTSFAAPVRARLGPRGFQPATKRA